MSDTLELNHIALETLPESAYAHSEIWRKHLRIKRGEKILISAPSGKGKSSLMSLLYGLRRNYTGVYKINGADARTFSAEDWSDARTHTLGMVFQDLRMFSAYTGWENLAIKGKLTEEIYDENTVGIMARHLGIESLLNKKCGEMSFGEKQRLAIIRSLLSPVAFLLMDEPFSHLDQKNTAKAFELIQNEATKNQSALLITSLDAQFQGDFDREITL